ncbi:fumarylacetoacetate hydrolase family protein [Methanobacterium alcaliphilum]|uniref:fumarylacetoacetate hydrolase family protein n=1 Tax=Methanobacterium alcaliphilum TaxID=392018 RepID=UPI00200A1696|nr:fumarylacetoacetate hydrolase family protein [Methanobacterium alcaliphilum]MCK9152336.1 fumarylacetoacetate hydrolase family protein [Methanobacterium alcaliphilum]
MKFLRFKKRGKIKTGYLKGEEIIETSFPILDALKSPEKAFKSSIQSFLKEEVQILSPVIPSKIICVGLNYRDHARELNMEIPEEPIIFMKPPSGIIGQEDEIIYPQTSQEVDYEAEMAIIISDKAKNVTSTGAVDFIGGYTAMNDVTARDIQRKDGQWTRAKSFDTFCPLGPCIETEMDPDNQNISLKLNGEFKQNSNTKNMIFKVSDLVEFISDAMTLNPGDVIATGTPPGVGQMYPGDSVQVQIEDIGILENKVIKY